jgi:phosphopantetheinyl transferase/malonyl CoA-acyl carrier protein transacylase
MDNCPNQVVICGDKDTAAAAVDQLRGTGAICQVLPFARPYHTPLFDSACGLLREFFGDLRIIAPKTKIYSCMTAGLMPSEPDGIRSQAVEQWALQVRFRETIEAMYSAGVRIFLEVGPQANLTGFVNDILKRKPHLAVASNVKRRSGVTQLNHALGLLAAHGVHMQLDYLYRRRLPQELDLEMTGEVADDLGAQKRAPKLSLALPIVGLEVKEPEGSQDRLSSGLAAELEDQSQSQPARLSRQNNESLNAGVGGRFASALAGQGTTTAGSIGIQAQTMREYLQTMERFLDVQQEVMHAYQAGHSKASVGPETRDSAAPTVPPIEDHAHPDVTASLRADQTLSVSQAESSLAPPKLALSSRESLEKLLLSLVSQKTGYPVDMLRVDQDLEADLGIDSIKRVEILGDLQKQIGTFEGDEMERLAGLKTLQQMVALLLERQGGQKVTETVSPSLSGANGDSDMPFIGTITSHITGKELSALREFDLDEDLFFLDHTLGREISVTDKDLTGLPIMPLTVSLEIMAEAASLLLPDGLFIGMRDIRAYRWVTLENKRLTLRVNAKCQSGKEVRVELREADDAADAGTSLGLPVIEGTVLFGERYPEPPTLDSFTLQGRRASRWNSDELYSEGMFSGPCFQGMVSMDWWGEDGAEATIKTLPSDGFFRDRSSVRFVTDPVLLDAAGQLIAYWIADHRETGFNVYPFRVDAIHVYGPNLRPHEQAKCRARIRPLSENQLRSTIDVIGPDGRLHMRLAGWDDRSFDLPNDFYRVRFRPGEVVLSTRWSKPISGLSEAGGLECCRMEDFPDDLLHSHGMVWLRVLAHLVLSRRERDVWSKLTGPKKRRIEWLLARVAGKDAVRLLLKKHHGIELCLPDIEIESDEHGRPFVNGLWTREVNRVPSLSLSHTRGIGMALASEKGEKCGIDVERLSSRTEGIEQIAFNPDERDLLKTILPEGMEWPLRIWCAKEAVGKALGWGLPAGPRDLTARELDVEKGWVNLEVSGKLAKLFPQLTGKPLQASTLREGDLIVASAIYRQEELD